LTLVRQRIQRPSSTGESHTVLGAVGVTATSIIEIELLEGVREVMRITQPFKLAADSSKPEGTIVDLGRGVKSAVLKLSSPQAGVRRITRTDFFRC